MPRDGEIEALLPDQRACRQGEKWAQSARHLGQSAPPQCGVFHRGSYGCAPEKSVKIVDVACTHVACGIRAEKDEGRRTPIRNVSERFVV
jgi:hypothetical protein